MRPLFSSLLAASLVLGQSAAAMASQCTRPPDKVAFDIAGLKSQLMVTALSCSAQDKYNAFVTRFRPNLVAQDQVLTKYFGRAYGRRAQQQHDDYVTSLANQQSEEGTKLGNAFCTKKVAMFDEVMALSNPTDLPVYAAGKGLTQPIDLVSCPAVPVRVARASGSKHKRTLRS